MRNRQLLIIQGETMPIYWILIIAAILVAIFSDKIDKKINANGKLKKVIIAVCILLVIAVTVLIKMAL